MKKRKQRSIEEILTPKEKPQEIKEKCPCCKGENSVVINERRHWEYGNFCGLHIKGDILEGLNLCLDCGCVFVGKNMIKSIKNKLGEI